MSKRLNRLGPICGTLRDAEESLWMIEFSKICLQQNSIFESFENPGIFYKINEIFICFCLQFVQREAPCKPCF